MSEKPVISIVTPVLNAHRFIQETVESVLAQKGDFELEYIVRDGGSDDGTLEILRDYSDRLRVVSAPDRGPQEAVNAGLSEARGTILAWLNADDVYEPGALASAADALRPQARKWTYGRCCIIDEHGDEIRKAITWYKTLVGWRYSRNILLCENFISQPAVFFRRELWESAGGLATCWRAAFDYDLWLRFARLSPAHPVHRVIARFRRHPGSISEATFERQFEEELRLARREGGRLHGLIHRFNTWKILTVYRWLNRRNRKHGDAT